MRGAIVDAFEAWCGECRKKNGRNINWVLRPFFCAIRGVIGDCYCILCNLLVLITGLDG